MPGGCWPWARRLAFDPAAGPSATADEAAALGEAGLDLAIVYLRPPLTPAVLEPLAEAFARIG